MSLIKIDLSNDGPRNTVIEVHVSLDSVPTEPVVILDPSERYVDPLTPTTMYRVDYVNYVLHTGLMVDLWWQSEDGEHKLIRHFEGRGQIDTESRGGLSNTAEKKTGRIMLSASGWESGVPLKGSLTIEAVKQ